MTTFWETVFFDVKITDDGLYHVTNHLGPFGGQHHVHTLESWLRYKQKRGVHPGPKLNEYYASCDCGLLSGTVEEYDGTVHVAVDGEDDNVEEK